MMFQENTAVLGAPQTIGKTFPSSEPLLQGPGHSMPVSLLPPSLEPPTYVTLGRQYPTSFPRRASATRFIKELRIISR